MSIEDETIRLFGNAKTQRVGRKIQNLTCPQCKKNDAYVDFDKGTLLLCNHKNNCGYSANIFDITDYNRKNNDYISTYRKLNISKEDENFITLASGTCIRKDKDFLTFKLENGEYWRVNQKTNEKRFAKNSKAKETFFKAFTNKPSKSIFLVESVFCALTLQQIGINAIAYLSAMFYPLNDSVLNEIKNKKVVIIPDNDKAGITFYKKVKRQLGKHEVFLFPSGYDVNSIEKSKNKILKEELENARIRGKILECKSVEEYHSQVHIFLYNSSFFEYKGKTYFAQKIKDEYKISLFFNGILKPLYKIYSERNDCFYWQFKELHNKRIITVSAKEIINSRLFLERIASDCGCTGTIASQKIYPHDYVEFLQNDNNFINVIEVKSVGMTDKGFLFEKSYSNYREYNSKDNIVSIAGNNYKLPSIEIKGMQIDENQNYKDDNIINLLHNAYGSVGIVALAYYVSTLFCDKIQEKNGSFPFLKITGSAGTGKSTLLMALNRLFGIKGEGLNIKGITTSAFNRTITSVKNIPIAIIEMNSDNFIFSEDVLKALYNFNTPFIKSDLTDNNKTVSSEFQTGLIFAQNFDSFKDRATKERMIDINMDSLPQNDKTRINLQALKEIRPYSVIHDVLTCKFNFIEIWNNAKAFKCDNFRLKDNITAIRFALLLLHKIYNNEILLNVLEKLEKYQTEILNNLNTELDELIPYLEDFCLSESGVKNNKGIIYENRYYFQMNSFIAYLRNQNIIEYNSKKVVKILSESNRKYENKIKNKAGICDKPTRYHSIKRDMKHKTP